MRDRLDDTHYTISIGSRVSMAVIGFYSGARVLSKGERVLATWREETRLWHIDGVGVPIANLQLTRLDTDASLSGTHRSAVSWHDSDFFAALTGADPRLNMLPWDGAVIGTNATGAGEGTEKGVAISHNGLYIATVDFIEDTLRIYNFTAGAFGSLINESTTGGNGTDIHGIDWSPDDDYVAISHSSSPYLLTLPFDGATIGSPATPATPPLATGGGGDSTKQGVSWSPDGSSLAVAQNGGNFLLVYPMTAGAFGMPVAPSSAVNASAGGGYGVAWAAGSDFVGLAVDDDPFVVVYPWNGAALGSAITPAMNNAGTGWGRSVRFDRNDKAVFVIGSDMDDGENFYAYAFSGSALIDRVDADLTPGTDPVGMDLSADNTAVVTFNAAQDVAVYATGLVTRAASAPTEQLASTDLSDFQEV